MPETIFRGLFDTDLTAVISVTDFLLCLGCSLVLGLILAFAYMYRSRYTKSFLVTLALLPGVVCVVIMLVNGCKIITPGKTYDLQNESDEQFTDMKFMFSRSELKTINSRLVRGRNHSASEGKYMGSMAPYGYRTFKLPGEKGNSLCIEPEEAKVVQMIFDMYGQQGMGYNAIAYRLNDLCIPARKGEWAQTSIVNILTTEEKNRLWKLVLQKVTVFRTPEGELSVHIYPKLPR